MSRFICSIKKSTLTQHYLTSDRAAMSSTLCNCADHVEKFTHQISVMRKELKNLRQQVDGAIRAHRKQMSSLESVLTSVEQEKEVNVNKTAPKSTKPANVSLEQGHIQTVPIGYINSCFGAKNGTPRQPTVCSLSRASLKIEQSVFNNPDHPLVGLEHYSHVWIIFLFHKNGHMSYKAKVKPPRLNGQRVGVYSTRSPHRPNALGLTLAKLERVEGDTLYLSEVDMISGTPVLDIKPYIPDYDSPHARADQGGDDSVLPSSEVFDTVYRQPDNKTKVQTKAVGEIREADPEPDPTQILKEPVCSLPNSENDITNPDSASEGSVLDCKRRDLLAEVTQYLHQGEPFTQQVVEEKASRSSEPAGSDTQRDRDTKLCYGEEAYSTIASWIRDPPVSTLDVRFTPTAEQELSEFGPPESTDPGKPRFQFLRGPEEAAAAIRGVLSADPRSVYRRTRCRDRLFFFSLDTADVACWFGEGFAEVVRVRPTSLS